MGFDYTHFPESEERQRWMHVTLSPYQYMNISSAGTNTIKTGSGILKALNVNTAVTSGVATVYDSLSGSGDIIARIAFPTVSLLQSLVPVEFNVKFNTGLTIVTVGNLDVTVIYR